MARGKHAAKSAIRRAEAAHEHIDRLTDQLVEAKARARRYEADALRVPALEGEIRRLRQQVEDGTSDALKEERVRGEQRAFNFQERLCSVGMLLGVMVHDLKEKGVDVIMPPEMWHLLTDSLGLDAMKEYREMRESLTRGQARALRPSKLSSLQGYSRPVNNLTNTARTERRRSVPMMSDAP